jgi:hypothetical protein
LKVYLKKDKLNRIMNEQSTIEKIRTWMHTNAETFSKLVSLAFLVFGILVVIGAVKNWDWLFKPDESYHGRWTIGQISRYLGRGTARVLGFIGGLLLIAAGAFWTYLAFSRH